MLKYFRIVGLLECVSFLALLFIAMPVKYFLGISEAVRIPGLIHGILFLMYVFGALAIGLDHGWPKKIILLAWGASLIPFGPILFDRKVLGRHTSVD